MQNPEMGCVGGKVAYLFLVIAILFCQTNRD